MADIKDFLSLIWVPGLVAIGFFSALYWNQRQILSELKHRRLVEDKHSKQIHDLEIDVTKLKADHNGAFALLHQKLDNLKEVMDIISKRLNSLK